MLFRSIHTVTSWLFASTSRIGWDSSIFGPYFVTGAFVSGSAAVIIAMYFYRKNYKLEDYFKEDNGSNKVKFASEYIRLMRDEFSDSKYIPNWINEIKNI